MSTPPIFTVTPARKALLQVLAGFAFWLGGTALLTANFGHWAGMIFFLSVMTVGFVSLMWVYADEITAMRHAPRKDQP